MKAAYVGNILSRSTVTRMAPCWGAFVFKRFSLKPILGIQKLSRQHCRVVTTFHFSGRINQPKKDQLTG
jgi:hypothetical protein